MKPFSVSLRALAAWVGIAALLVTIPRAIERAQGPIAYGHETSEGNFPVRGEIPLDSIFGAPGVRGDRGAILGPKHSERYWSSWAGDAASRGRLVLGPFPAPACLAIDVCGYPAAGGNALYLRKADSGERLTLLSSNVGPTWTEIRAAIPEAWRGQPVVLVAEDASGAAYGWLAVGEPRAVPRWAAFWSGNAPTLSVLAEVVFVACLLQLAALRLLRSQDVIPEGLRPVAAATLWLVVGYVLFWGFLASPLLGSIAVGLLVLAALLLVSSAETPTRTGFPFLPVLCVGIGLLYVGLLLAYEPARSLHDVAARRFSQDVGGDNQLPGDLARRLAQGLPTRSLTYGISSSERPPLQAGADLLLALPASLLGSDFDTAAQWAGLCLQLLWIPAAWAWLRSMDLSERARSAIISGVAFSGFFILHTTFVWPKLLCASLTMAGFLLLVEEPEEAAFRRPRIVLAGVFFALALLSHPACAFALLGLLPLVAPKLVREPRVSLAAALLAGGLLAPWSAYQSGDPAASHLLKWHLAGVTAIDSRGTAQTLVQAYRTAGLTAVLKARALDLRRMVGGPWQDWAQPGSTPQAERRTAEYFSTFYALGPWVLGLAAWVFLAWRKQAGRLPLLSLGWCAFSLAVWVLVMFQPGGTLIHQGAYAIEVLLFLLGASALWRMSPLLFAAAAVLQAINFLYVWVPPVSTAPAAFDALALAIAITGLAVLGSISLACFRRS